MIISARSLFLLATLLFSFASTNAQQLPSNRYDDYDREKYASILAQSENILQQAYNDLQRAEQALAQALAREQEVGNMLQTARKTLQTNMAREIEINTEIKNQEQIIANGNSALPGLQQELSVLQNSLDQAQANIEKLKSQVDAAKADTAAKKIAADEAQKNLASAQQSLSAAQNNLSQTQNKILELKKKLETATPEEAPAIKAELDAELAKVPGLLAQQATAQQAVNNSQTASTNAQNALKSAQDKEASVQKEMNQATALAQDLTKLKTQKQAAIEKIRADVQTASNRVEQLRKNLIEVRQQIVQQTQRVKELETALMQAQAQSKQKLYERDSFNGIYAQRLKDRDNAARYLQWVDSNIEKARQIVTAKATADASADGDREGRELGAQNGSRDGDIRGQADGNNQGTADGQKRDYEIGRQQGIDRATTDAKAKAEADAEARGKADGEANGKTDGLAAAFARGKADGLKHGEETGSDTVAYNKGRVRGEADGKAQAIEDAKPQEGLGYHDQEQKYLSATLKPVIIGDAAKFKGLQGKYSQYGDDRYYRPQPGNYPHNRITVFYMQAYDLNYRQSLDGIYPQVYKAAYDSSYSAAYKQAYAQAYNQQYESSRVAGYNDGYKATYQPAYDKVFNAVYPVRYKFYYDKTYAVYVLDKNEYDRGFAVGNAIASEAKGYREGKEAAYNANIDLEKKKAYQAGIARANQLYQNNAVISLSSIELKDVDADGIFRPSESVVVIIKLKNFGLVAKSDLSMELSNASGAIQINSAKVNVASIPGQSDAIVAAPIQALIPGNSKDGSPFQVQGKLRDSKDLVGQQKFSGQALYPAAVNFIGFEDGILIPGQATTVTLKVSNRSKVVQNLVVKIEIDGTRVDADKTEIQVSKLASGSSENVKVILTGKKDAQFEESPLIISTKQGNLVYADEQEKMMTIIQRHKPTKESQGLILSSNLAQGSGKSIFAALKADTWDLRVDGPLTKAALDNYKNKIVYLMADRMSVLDDKSVAALLEHVNTTNSTLVAWSDSANQSKVIDQLQSILNVKAGSNEEVSGSITGEQALKGLNLSVQSQDVVLLAAVGPKSLPALKSNLGSVGVVSFGNGISSNVGRALTVAVTPKSLAKEHIASVHASIDLLRRSFEEKLELAAQSENNVYLVLRDIMDEMIGAETTPGKFYQDNAKKCKISKAVDRLIKGLDKKHPSRVAFIKSYPEAFAVASKLKEEFQVTNALEYKPSLLGASWKGSYCALDSSFAGCK